MTGRISRTALAVALAATAGCGGPVKEEMIEVKAADPLAEPKAALQRYANGQPMGSEVTSYPKMVQDVRAKDPAKADILEKGLDELQKAPVAARPAKAKELLKKLES